MIEEKEFQLTGNVSYSVKMRYKWLTEPGACKVCKAMHGRLYDKDKVPKKPHPNCKCHVEEVSVIDAEISKMHNYQDEIGILKLDTTRMFGDLKVCKTSLDMKIVNLQNKQIQKEKDDLEKEVDCIEKQVTKLSDDLNSHSAVYDFDYVKEKAKQVNNLKQRIIILNKKIDELRVKSRKVFVDDLVQLGEKQAPDAAALWKLAVTKFQEGMDYVNKNRYLVKKVSDLNDRELEDVVRKKLKSQHLKTELRGIVLESNSSLSRSIVNSGKFSEYLSKNIVELGLTDKLPNSSLSFGFLNSTPNNSLGIHNCDILNIYLDRQNTIHAKIIDTVDYNSNEPWVAIPHEMQEYGLLENYYIIIEIEVPYEKWKKYLE